MALWDKYKPQRGLVFYSPIAAMQAIIRPRKDIFSADGTKIDEIPELVLEFGRHGESYYMNDPEHEGDQVLIADVRGHYVDLDQQAEEKNWSEEDWELACRRMLWFCDQGWSQISLWSLPKAAAPWPTYDDTHHSKVVELAKTLGFVAEALNYEEQNKKRQSIIDGLRAALAESQAQPVEEIVAA